MRKIEEKSSYPKFPLHKVSHEERIELAKKIASQILDTYKGAVLAICIYASTAKRLDRPYSDLEIFCVATDGLEVKNKRYVYDGLLVEIDYFQASNFLKEAARVGWDWPLGADQYRNRIVLFERDNWLKKLEKAIAENDTADFTEEYRWAIMSMTESLAAVRNARLQGDQRDLRTRAFYMAWDTARVVFYHNRKYVLTTSWFWKQLFECQEQPRGFRKLIDLVAGFEKSTNSELVDATEELWRQTMMMVQPRRISIESGKITV
ncbi:MAG TPA: kanamycin nucleotidyltransferase C-terminal domain-containing protein [Candidatus Bathyarchaeia archaeon]|nr:kanamycin nucleotidyltransferase C-terminal domain-containing protein [Candidatus Bathyarchaeia archaeon]